jgi:Ca-activated chloride channel family protein
MRRGFPVLMLVGVVLGVMEAAAAARQQTTPPPVQSPQQPMFRAGVQTVPLYATVIDSTGHLIPDLEEKDFQIYDNGKLQQLTLFKSDVQPVTVMLALDTSGSMTMNLELLKDAAEAFVIRLMPKDKARIINFDDKIVASPIFTGNRDDLIRYIHEDIQYGNGTRLWDATDASMHALTQIEGRKVVLLFTDGNDEGSKTAGFDEVMKRAQTEDVMIYSVGLQSTILHTTTHPDKGIRKLAEATGGGWFELTKAADLNSTFTRVADELHRQYVLGFSPALLDNKIHQLDVKVMKTGMTVRTRKTYLASRPQ